MCKRPRENPEPGTSVGLDNIPPKLAVMSAEIIAEPLSNLINATMLDEQIFPDVEIEASVIPAFKKEDRQTKKTTDQSVF